MNVHDGTDALIECIDGGVRHCLRRGPDRAAAGDRVGRNIHARDQRVVTIIGDGEMAGLRAADQKRPGVAAAHADIAVADPEVGVFTDQPRLVERLTPAIEFKR